MKVAILAGGVGSRLSEETEVKPKPMVEIGGKPILWHIMMYYSQFGFNDFVIALGYKGEVIKKYMVDYCALNSNLSVCFSTGAIRITQRQICNWNVELIDTGTETQTGGRIKRLQPFLGDETFMLTWGDGVSNVDLHRLLAFHRKHGKLATLTAVRPTARFGHLETDGDRVVEFSEKPQTREGWINGAFFVLEPSVFQYIDADLTHWEREPMEKLAKDGQLMAYHHDSFWQCMDTLREKKLLEAMWESGKAPWKIWKEEKNESISDGSRGVHWDGLGSNAVVGQTRANGV
jgi:glucose-1-phosphate cytidylyltransferase